MSDKTVMDAKTFFKTYFDRLIRISGYSFADLMPTNINNLQLRDNGYSNEIKQAERVIHCVAKAINDSKSEPRKPYEAILTGVYLKNELNWKVRNEIGYSNTRYYVLKKQALKEFAERFNYYVVQEGISSLIELS
ncbi:MAG: DUF1492 domain-containing protein [Lactobacillus crispatus]|nr:DUF1492 domain-containing protein [Lactobacillus crispatus]